ncbi:MAG: argininosuccinate lyase [Clostridia bacterium]|nr:MAG: argininosuccinate lyase [Clostridia bacterium]
MNKLWGGRFDQPTDSLMDQFNKSIGFDARLWKVDILASQAYARAICEAGVLSEEERDMIIDGLERVAEEWQADAFILQPGDEDIHTAVERRLTELIGPTAGKLHTGRSRNDQVATDLRLYLCLALQEMEDRLNGLQLTLIDVAERTIDLIMPGYTHLQPAQPVRFAHWMMSFFWMLQRDWSRLEDMRRRIEVLPLGSGALAGTPLAVDRVKLAEDLGFGRISENSMDGVSDRDFVAEFLFWASMLAIHLSRLSEDVILYASPAFGFIRLSDAYTTGSSLMPQKKNPDAFELMRGKTGRIIGHLAGLLTTLKGLPSTYNKDLQEDKEPLFDVIDTLMLALPVMTGALATMTLDADKMHSALNDAMLATDLADWLVARGIPFRQSHHIVGQVVQAAEQRQVSLGQLSLDELRAIHPAFTADALAVWDFERSVDQRNAAGGTARAAVLAQITRARATMGQTA